MNNDQSMEKIWTKSFVFIFLSNFFLFLTFYALLTTLPIFVLEELSGSETQAGLVATIFLLSAIIVRPFSGRLLGDFGKKKMLIISMLLFMASSFLYIGINSLYLLLALRFFHGIWFSIASTATGAIAADIVPETRRGEGLGYYVMSQNIAVVVGPFIGLTLLQVTTFQNLFLVLSVLMVGAIVFTSLVSDPTAAKPSKRKLSVSDLFDGKALPIAAVASLIAFSYSAILSFISIYAKSIGLIEAASYFYVLFAAAMLLSRPFVGRLFDRVGPNIVIYPSIGLFAAGLLVLSIVQSPMMLFLSAILVGLGYGTVVPCLQTLAIQSAGKGRSAHATATFFTLFDTGVATGSYVLGLIATNFGFQQLYITTGIFMIVVVFAYKLMMKKRKETEVKNYKPVKIG
ncbi:MFS transporter [Aquibacillus salsiterrae]|uniref:MFS transporter n=1 Tax=Aquibacillus salsiterrae TaxID=2950439 RepID=A0A9X3WIW0_9BACI|nr:MFS transporter [Aquibacillus salsiterrae]MDC3418259.1 MFS transporter [Aquibacillus salsiterrae]